MNDEFVPDLIITPNHPLGRLATIYLNGQEVKYVFEVRISWLSLKEPTFGEIIYADGDSLKSVTLTKPGLGEFNYDGVWVKLACGKVQVDVGEAGKRCLQVMDFYGTLS